MACRSAGWRSSRPIAPPGAYDIAGTTDDRLDVFANGRALYRSGSAVHNCYPMPIHPEIHACRVIDRANDALLGEFTYSTVDNATESPAPIHGVVGSTRVALYPY